MNLHKRLLTKAVQADIDLADRLAGKVISITGASGFLASSLLAYLHELRRVSGRQFSLHATARRKICDIPLFKFLGATPEVTWEISSAENCILPNKREIVVVHAASYGAPADYLREPIETYSANTEGLLNLFRQHDKIGHLIYISSAEIYGQPPTCSIPTHEGYVGGLPTLAVRSIYGESKRMAEVLGCTLGHLHNVAFSALRPWNIYGPGQRLNDGRVPFEFIRQACSSGRVTLASNGTPTRGFCYVWDGISQIARTLVPETKLQAYNIGNGSEEIPMLELARKCAVACGHTTNVVTYNENAQTGGLQRCAPSVDAVRRIAPNSRPFVALDEGLATLVEWYRFLSCLKA